MQDKLILLKIHGFVITNVQNQLETSLDLKRLQLSLFV